MMDAAGRIAWSRTLNSGVPDRPATPEDYSPFFVCPDCRQPMSHERGDCHPCPKCEREGRGYRDLWHVGDPHTAYTGVAFNGVDELVEEQTARCLVCGYTCGADEREVRHNDSICGVCGYVGEPVDKREEAREQGL